MLHVTNGESVSLADTGLGGEVLCWRDSLHGDGEPAKLEVIDKTTIRYSWSKPNANFLPALALRPDLFSPALPPSSASRGRA